MESEVGSAPSGCTSTVKEADSGSSSERGDTFNSMSLDGNRNRSERRNNDVSCISELKGTFSVAVRKKRGRRAPPSSRFLHGKKDDKVIGSDNAVNNYNHEREEGQAGKSQSISHIKESVNGKTGGLDLLKTDNSEKESEPRRSQQDTFHLKQDGVDSEPTGQSVSANEACEKSNALENASNVQTAALKKTTAEDKTSQSIMDDVSDAQMDTTSSDDKSAEEVEDVKVCDICGDVGEEEKLAVCSRCNDGAEHIYCMRVMMEYVPEGEWFCEECQTEVEFEKEKKKLEKSQVKVGIGISKEKSFEGKISKPINAAKSRSSSENEMEAENVGSKELDKINQGNDMVTRSKEEDAGITSVVRQNLPEPGGLSMGPDSRKRVPLSRERSFRLDVEKGKQPAPQMPTLSSAAKNQAAPIRGPFSKSTSFNNSKVPKVKQLVNEVPPKPNILKDPLSCGMKKEGPMGLSARSASFKKPKSCEPANKAKSSILPPAEDPRVLNSPVSRNVNTDRGTSILGCPSITGSMAIPVPSKAESATQHLVTGNNMADYNNLGVAHEQCARSSLGDSELKKPLLSKAPVSITSTSAERSSCILVSGAQRNVIQNSDASHRDDKIKDQPSLRPGVSSSSRTIRCQRCNEVGHSTQFCAVDKLRPSAMKPLSERNLKDASAKRNKTSEAANLVTTEKASSRSADQSEHVLSCGPYHNPIYRPKDMLSTSFSHVQEPSQLYLQTNEQDLGNSLSTPINSASAYCSKLTFKERQATGRSVDSSSTMSSDLMDKSSQGFSPGDETIVSTVPELDYIWQGGFELWRTGRSPELCDGFQAHLSCSASPKVLEVAKKFPSKVQLEELPRQNSWPTQFQENGPTYDNIGLFFFARDTQSYENHYSKLVQNMLNNDLALRGNIETAELLIFPSNILSKNFQRWNMFYFLWGVFRVKRKDHLNLPPDVPISKCQPNLNEDPLAVDLNTSVLPSSHSFSEDQNYVARSDFSFLKPATCAGHQYLHALEANHQGCSNGENSSEQPVGGRDLEDHHHNSITTSCSTNNKSAINYFSTAPARKDPKLAYSDSLNKMWDSSGGYADKPIFDVNMAPVTCFISSIHEEGNDSRPINLNNVESLMGVDHVNTTEVNSGGVDPVSHVSGSAHKRNVDMANWADGVNGTLEHKKIKLDNVGSAHSSLSENMTAGRLSSKVHPLAACSVDDCTDNKAMAGTSKSNGKCIFALDLNVVDDSVTGNIVNILSSDDEDLPEREAPDLELDLGDKSPRKPMFSFLSPKVEEKQNKGDSLPIDTPGSLFLSLAFPASKEQAGKLQSESQKQLPERSSRNKSSSIWDQQ